MHFSEVLPYLTAADVYQRFPPPVGSLSFLIQTLQHEEGQMSWAHNKGFYAVFDFVHCIVDVSEVTCIVPFVTSVNFMERSAGPWVTLAPVL